MIHEVIGYIEVKNENRYLVFDSADKSKEVLKKYTELWDGIKNEIETINGGETGKYGKDLKFQQLQQLLDLFLKKMVNIILMFI